MGMVLTDERWVALAPLLEACRPKGKSMPPVNTAAVLVDADEPV